MRRLHTHKVPSTNWFQAEIEWMRMKMWQAQAHLHFILEKQKNKKKEDDFLWILVTFSVKLLKNQMQD